jgi:hypothetical protein
MRIWDIPPDKLCRVHLLAEHRELHGLWSILTQDKAGYAHHPETRRWRGKEKALYLRHEALVEEMLRRGYSHKTPLDSTLAIGSDTQTDYVNTPQEQVRILNDKACGCSV